MTYIFKTENFTAEITIKAVKTLRARIMQDGRVLVSAPKGMKHDYIERFLIEKTEWIKSAIMKAEKRNATMAGGLKEGGTVLVWGEKYPLVFKIGKKLLAERQEKEVIVTAPCLTTEAVTIALKAMYKKELSTIFPPRLACYEAQIGLKASAVSVRDMATRWGSCTASTRKIRLSLNLAKKPLECLDYVLVHELCHIRYPNHQKQFNAMVEQFYAGRKYIEKLLRA